MLNLIIKNTHFKIDYSESSKKTEIIKFLKEKFTFQDSSLLNTWEVKKKLKSPYISFYEESYDILPTGFLAFTKLFLKKNNYEFKITDLRKFPSVNTEFLNSVISFTDFKGNKYIPRDYQLEAVKEITSKRGGCIQIGTGLGKGFIHALLCHTYSKARILNIFDRIDLINQTYDAFTNKYGFSSKDIGIIQGTRVEDNKRIILLSLQSYENALSVFPYVNVIIGDEAHSTMRNNTAEKIIFGCQNASVKIGLSATIDKVSNPYEQAKLYSIAGPIVYKKDIIDGIRENSLSPGDVIFHRYNSEAVEFKPTYQDVYETKKTKKPEFKNLSFTVTENSLKIIKRKEEVLEITDKEEIKKIEAVNMLNNKDLLLETLSDYLRTEIEKSYIKDGWIFFNKNGDRYMKKFKDYGNESLLYIENNKRNSIIAELARKETSKGRRTIILFNRLEHGKKLSELLPEGKLISGINTINERNEVEAFIKQNKNGIVIVSTIWQTGKDIPELESFINASGGKSAISFIQKLGRLTRKAVNKKRFYFHDFDDSHLGGIGKKQTNERIKISLDLQLPVFYEEHN